MLPEPMEELAFLGQVKQGLNCSCIKYTELTGRLVRKVDKKTLSGVKVDIKPPLRQIPNQQKVNNIGPDPKPASLHQLKRILPGPA